MIHFDLCIIFQANTDLLSKDPGGVSQFCLPKSRLYILGDKFPQ